MKLQLLARGKPVANSEITVLLPDGSQRKLQTDAAGQTETLAQSGRFGAWARFWEAAFGERDGKRYQEIHHYATLVFDAAVAGAIPAAVSFATMPEATASFGAVVSGGWLYVYGGHVSPTHSYSTDAVSGKFFRMNLAGPGKWEELPGGPGLQGMNLATYAGKIYRIGGMMPRNQPGHAADNFSSADCARFDPASQVWEALPPMPEPRSSHDVVVIGDQLIVTGGWDMEGKAGQHWSDTMFTLDLSAPKLEWKSAPQPFRRRALIAAVYQGRMFVMGGITDMGKVVGDVDIYDPRTKAWTKGPALPGSGVNPFAPAAAVDAGSLYVSVADGTLYRLDRSEQSWEKVGRGTPRVAHRAVADGQSILVMGGAEKGMNLDLIEAIPVNQVR
jgi:N-acetylneuraminic acid mutarotase